jgi:hypothetical protein
MRSSHLFDRHRAANPEIELAVGNGPNVVAHLVNRGRSRNPESALRRGQEFPVPVALIAAGP